MQRNLAATMDGKDDRFRDTGLHQVANSKAILPTNEHKLVGPQAESTIPKAQRYISSSYSGYSNQHTQREAAAQ